MRTHLSCLLFPLVLIGVGSSAHADTLVLANGDEINGEIIEWAVDHVVIEHPQLGTMRVELDQLKLDTGTPPNPGLFGTRFLRGWRRRIDLGINGQQDDSPTSSLTFGSKFAYEDPWTRWRINGRYFYDASDDDDDDNNATVDLRRDWLNPESRWFSALGGRYQFDQYKDWKHRITIFGGPGFHLVDTERHALNLLVGPAFTREFGASNADKAESVLALSYEWKISDRQSFGFANQHFFQLSPKAGDWRNFSTLAWVPASHGGSRAEPEPRPPERVREQPGPGRLQQRPQVLPDAGIGLLRRNQRLAVLGSPGTTTTLWVLA